MTATTMSISSACKLPNAMTMLRSCPGWVFALDADPRLLEDREATSIGTELAREVRIAR